MLERFKVKETDAVRVRESALRETVTQVFKKMGVPDGDDELASDRPPCRRSAWCGEPRCLQHAALLYPRLQQWRAKPPTQLACPPRDLPPATANIDSDAGLGIIVVPKAMRIAIEKAKKVGVGMVTIRNARHLGMASYHAMLALDHDMIGMCVTSCPPSVLPTFGAEPAMGTNPHPFGGAGRRGAALCL